tara:strand:+ start:147 stop:605 length:459 start_codon:yes stop_codon:yes gene_type:complete
MSSDKFDFIITEIPQNIDKKMIKHLKESVLNLDIDESLAINRLLAIDISDISCESLDESDLFDVGDEDLKVKKAIQDFLIEAISEVLVPRMYCEKRISSPLNVGEFSYITIKDKPYVISGQQTSYYSSRLSSGYKYVLALSLSNILEPYIEG